MTHGRPRRTTAETTVAMSADPQRMCPIGTQRKMSMSSPTTIPALVTARSSPENTLMRGIPAAKSSPRIAVLIVTMMMRTRSTDCPRWRARALRGCRRSRPVNRLNESDTSPSAEEVVQHMVRIASSKMSGDDARNPLTPERISARTFSGRNRYVSFVMVFATTWSPEMRAASAAMPNTSGIKETRRK